MKKLITLVLVLTGMVSTASADEWSLRGSMNGWDGEANIFNATTGQTTVTLTAGTEYTFKLVNNSKGEWWTANNTMWWGNCTSRNFSIKGGDNNDTKITADVGGEYIFTITNPSAEDSPVLTITYPGLVTRKVYFYNNLGWSQPYAYFLRNKYWNDGQGSGSNGQFEGVAMTQVAEGSKIWKAEFVGWSPNCTMENIAILKDSKNSYEHFHQTEAVYNEHCSNNKMLVPDANRFTTINETKYYNYDSGNLEGTWFDYPYTRDVTSGNFGTICLPFDATVSGATLFTITSQIKDGNNELVGLNLTSVSSATAGVSYIYKATASTLTATYTGSTYTTTPISSGNMSGNLSTTPADVSIGNYIIKDNQLRKIVDGGAATVGQYKACILNSIESLSVGARGTDYIDFVDESAGIDEIESTRNVDNETFFNLAGQRVVQPTKGLYIVNGRKMLRK